MTKQRHTWIWLANLVIFSAVIVYQIWHKEQVLEKGKLVLLELAPVDPRSLMQGDYMILRYAETADTYQKDIPARGWAVFSPDSAGIAKLLRYQKDQTLQSDEEQLIRYYFNDRFVSIGAESYFFEEGSAARFDSASYGGLRVMPNGESVLVGLYDQDFTYIHP